MAIDANNQVGLQMKYFVLKPHGNDEFARASRTAMRAYATAIEHINSALAQELRKWAASEMYSAAEKLSGD